MLIREVNWRRIKRFENKHVIGDEVYVAYCRGGYDASRNRPSKNIYPPGRRHRAYNDGYSSEIEQREEDRYVR